MVEAIQERQKYFCELKETGCNSGACDNVPDYIRREMFLFNPKKPAFLAEVAKSIISNLASRSLENIERDPSVIAEAKLPNFSCIKATVSAFSREELGTFFAEGCVEAISRAVRGVSKKTATGEDLFIYNCLAEIGAQKEIQAGGGIDKNELLETLKWYFSDHFIFKVPKGASKYIDLDKLNSQQRKAPTNEFSFVVPVPDNSHKNIYDLFTSTQKAIIELSARGRSGKEIGKDLSIPYGTVRENVERILKMSENEWIQQVVFRCIASGVINPSKMIDDTTFLSIAQFTPRERDVMISITTPPYEIVTDENIASYLGLKRKRVQNLVYRVLEKLNTPSRISAGVAYIAYKQSRVREQVPVLSR